MTKLSENLPIEEARERLRQLIMELAVVRGHVVLASGKEADYYVDLRRITLHHEASRLVGQVMLDPVSYTHLDVYKRQKPRSLEMLKGSS